MLKFILFGLVLLNLSNFIISQTEKNIINENVYSSLLARRREEHQLLVQHILKTDDYEKKYKLLKIALEKILSIIDENKQQFMATKYTIKDGFPKSKELLEIIGPILENTCLFGDLFLQIPTFSIKILSRQQDWRRRIEWSIQYFRTLFEMVADAKTLEMLTKLSKTINQTNEELHAAHSVEHQASSTTTTQKSKQKKKIQKGPGLARSNKNEL